MFLFVKMLFNGEVDLCFDYCFVLVVSFVVYGNFNIVCEVYIIEVDFCNFEVFIIGVFGFSC